MACCGVVNWPVSQINTGNAFNPKTNIFTAPIPGYYIFHFSSVGGSASKNRVTMQKNGNNLGAAWGQTMYDTMTLTSTLYLSKNDQVTLRLMEGSLFDNVNRMSHFSGILIDQSSLTI